MNFVVLGNEDVVLGFRFIGISGKIVETAAEAQLHFDEVTRGTYGDVGVLIITEKVSLLLGEKLLDWELSGMFPLVVEIPDLDGRLEGKKSLLQSIREAVGLHV